MKGDRLVRVIGFVLAAAGAAGALIINDDVELTLFMGAAVIAALAAFDAALDRHAKAFAPWILVMCAVLAKTVPTVLGRLSSAAGASAARIDHIGSVLAGLCVFAGLAWLARPPVGARERSRVAALLLLAPAVAGLAAAVATFAGRGALSGARAARVFETLGWASVGGIVMAVVVVAATRRVVPPATIFLGVGALAVALMVARTAAGNTDDIGWWAIALVLVSLGALLFSPATLGATQGHRDSIVPAMAAVLVAVFGVQSLVLGLRDEASTVLVVLLAIASAAMAIAALSWFRLTNQSTADVADPRRAEVLEILAETQIDDHGAMLDLPGAVENPWPEPSQTASRSRSSGSAFQAAVAGGASSGSTSPAAPVASPAPRATDPLRPEVATSVPSLSEAAEPPVPDAAAALADLDPVAQPSPRWATDIDSDIDDTTAALPRPEPAPTPAESAGSRPAASPAPSAGSRPAAPRAPATPLDATAPRRPAEPTPPAPAPTPAAPMSTSSRPPHDVPAHLIDPATGVQSAAGLEDGLRRAFSYPRQAGDVAILMVALRGLDRVETAHGRVVASQAISDIASRLAAHMPEARVARFATDGFAALVDGEPIETQALIQRCTGVLIDLLEPITVADRQITIDVFAGLAQCRRDEDITSFVGRANEGLAKATAAGEPTLIAMP